MRVLYMDGGKSESWLLVEQLGRHRCTVDVCGCAADALRALESLHYDLVMIDLGAADVDGPRVVDHLRDAGHGTRILVLIAQGRTEEGVATLNAGADDLLARPFDVAELAARLRALMRRPAAKSRVRLHTGNLEFTPGLTTMQVDGRPATLSRREALVLEHLMRAQGRPLSRAALEERLYAGGEKIGSNAIQVHIHFLRKRLESAGASVRIETLRGSGYVLHVPTCPAFAVEDVFLTNVA